VVTLYQPWDTEVLLPQMPNWDRRIGELSIRSHSLSLSGWFFPFPSLWPPCRWWWGRWAWNPPESSATSPRRATAEREGRAHAWSQFVLHLQPNQQV